MLTKSKPEDAKKFFAQAQTDADRRWANYQYMAGRDLKAGNGAATQAKPTATVDQQPSRITTQAYGFKDNLSGTETSHAAGSRGLSALGGD
jgi:hypothetical protein